VEVVQEAVHHTADGKKLWVIHGDHFDGVIQYAKWLAYLGDNLYELSLRLNTRLNSLRARLGLPYWSLSKYLKHRVKSAVNYVLSFEGVVAAEARKRGLDGVVCGHIHRAEMREIDGVLYCNDGDWVESLTALVEHRDGRLDLVHWQHDHKKAPDALPQPATETLSTASVEAQDGVAKAMGLPLGAPVHLIRRRRLIDGRPVLVERIYVEAERAPDLLAHDLDGSLTQILKSRYRLAVTRNRVEMQPCALIQEEAEALGVKSGTPGLLVIRASFDAAGRIVEYDHEYWRHDALRVKVDLDVTP
jgi:hypothetical protein